MIIIIIIMCIEYENYVVGVFLVRVLGADLSKDSAGWYIWF
jgi:hypothetical protein